MLPILINVNISSPGTKINTFLTSKKGVLLGVKVYVIFLS